MSAYQQYENEILQTQKLYFLEQERKRLQNQRQNLKLINEEKHTELRKMRKAVYEPYQNQLIVNK